MTDAVNTERNVKGEKKISAASQITGMAMLTAIVVILQILGSFIRFGPFSISLVLVPIVIGAALYGPKAGAWLGFVFGTVVLLSGDAAAFLAITVPGTIFTCLIKGILCGYSAGWIYSVLEKKNVTVATAAAGGVSAIVNTGVFILCCMAFFMEAINGWADAAGFEDVGKYLIVGFVGVNFLIEMGVNIVLGPMIIRLLKLADTLHG